jgi:hypothetical protein
MKRLLAVIIIFSLTGFSCNKLKLENDEFTGIVKDFTGLDGCGKMIVLDSGEKLEIVSLPANTALVVNRRIAIRYNPVPAVSICMAGTTVQITSLRYL